MGHIWGRGRAGCEEGGGTGEINSSYGISINGKSYLYTEKIIFSPTGRRMYVPMYPILIISIHRHVLLPDEQGVARNIDLLLYEEDSV